MENKNFIYGRDEYKTNKYILNKLNNKHITFESDYNFCNFCIFTDDLQMIDKIINDSNYYVMKFNSVVDINDYIQLSEELNDDNCLCKIFAYFKKYNVNNQLFFNHVKTTFQQNYRFLLVPIFKQMIYNNSDYFASKSLSANEIYNESLEYAKNINYNLGNIKYSEFKCSAKLPLYFNELIRIHRGHTKYIFYEHGCSNLKEYLQKKDPEYYNYVNNIA